MSVEVRNVASSQSPTGTKYAGAVDTERWPTFLSHRSFSLLHSAQDVGLYTPAVSRTSRLMLGYDAHTTRFLLLLRFLVLLAGAHLGCI